MAHGLDIYLDVTRSDGASVQFPDRLLGAIAAAPVFVCLLAESTLDSEWVLKEIRHARALNKPCIPVFQENWTRYTGSDADVLYLLNHDGVTILERRGLFVANAISDIAAIIKKTIPARTGRRRTPRYTMPIFIAAFLIAGVIALLVLPNLRDNDAQSPTTTPAPTIATTVSAAADSPTATDMLPTPTLVSPGEVGNPVTSNAQWMIQARDFDGVAMVRVPAGCFLMGSTIYPDEQPIEEQCFDGFWIDQFEVTQRQFADFDGVKATDNVFDGDQRPVERITWFEARDYCALWGAWLPSEAEREYAARGVDALQYPWGNTFERDNVVYVENANSQTAIVGSRPGGMSWVGAHDLSGNVWEWTRSIYADYPYDADDGREEFATNRTDSRAVRGGSFIVATVGLRAADRNGRSADFQYGLLGFRCARFE